jgi:predicted permease
LEIPETLAFRCLALHFYIVEPFLSQLDVPAPITRTLPSPPRIPATLLRALLPFAERDEVLADLADEYRYRVETFGSVTARVWYWRQVLASAPSLVRRSWWRGWSGFEPTANRMHPGGPSMESWIMDVRYAARRLVRRPLYALLSILTLALGIGGTAAVYGIARPILLDRLPYVAEEGLATFWSPFDWNEQEFLYLREGKFTGFSSVAAYRPDDVTLDRGDGGPARLLPGIATSAELFSVLGATPALGRMFQKGDDIQGAEPVAVLSYGVWQELGGDKSIIGSRVRLDGVARTIVGVMPRGFWFPDPSVRVWIAHPFNPENRAGNYAFVGRLAPGQRFESMAGPVATFVRTLDDRFDYNPQWDKTKNTVLTPLRTFLVGSLRPALIATLTAMGLILLIACANVAALMLGQVEGRTTELAVRSALGANRVRLTQQLVAEAVLLGLAAGVVGALLAAVAFRTVVGALPLGAWGEGASLDWSVFASAMAVAVGAAAIVAIAPGVAMWRGDLRETLGSSRTGGIAGRGGRLESSLVVAEVALAVVMAAGAGLLIRSVTKLYAVHPGIETSGVGVVDIVIPNDLEPARRRQTMDEISAALRSMPGVTSAGFSQKIPLRGGGWSFGFDMEGNPDARGTTTFVRFGSPDYLKTIGATLREGRFFAEADRRLYATEGAEGVIVVNEALVKKYFKGANPIGLRVANGTGGWGRVIGVVRDVAEAKLTDEPEPTRYMLTESLGSVPGVEVLVFKTAGRSPEALLDQARQTVQRLAPSVAVQQVTTMDRVFDLAVGPARQVMALLAILTSLALVLGAVGVYGVISHFVHRRSRDWGVRIALGMAPSNVVRMIVRRGVSLVGLGVVIGIGAFFALARLLGSFLYGVGAGDPLAMGSATAVLLVVGVLAALIPGLRASRTDPAIVLREQ